MAKRKRTKTKKTIAIYCGPARGGRHLDRFWSDYYAPKHYANARRRFWDFEEAGCFRDKLGEGRENFAALLKAAQERRFTDVVCMALDRLGDTNDEANANAGAIRACGVTLHFVEKPSSSAIQG